MPRSDRPQPADPDVFDLVIVGAGSAGLPAAIFAARRGRVLLVDHAPVIGGSLHVAQGQMSAAGTALQRRRGISDSPQAHLDDVLRLSKGTVDEPLVRLAVWEAAETLDWLETLGFQALPDHPVTGSGHEPYSAARYCWSAGGGRDILAALAPAVEAAVAGGNLELRLNCEVTALLPAEDGDGVAGVSVRDGEGRTVHVAARAVLLTTGGYNADPTLYAQISGRPLYAAMAYPYARGAGHRMATREGGYLRGAENFFSNFGYTLDSEALPARLAGRAITYPERRTPWEIYVNAAGERFVREDEPSIDRRENALLAQPDERYWIVFDHAILQAAPPLFAGWTREELTSAFDGRPFFHRAPTLEALASAASVDPQGLARTVDAYNLGRSAGADALGRPAPPSPIATPPFYAVRQQGATVTSAAGVAVDGRLQVLRADGSVVPNLYAAGEILGAGQLMGRATCGGMMVTPALTFGRLLGQSLIPIEAAQLV